MLMSSLAQAKQLVLTTRNVVNVRGVINQISMSKALSEVYALNKRRGKRRYPIYLAIYSDGGMVDSGVYFLNNVRAIKNLHTITINAGSMAAAIVQKLKGRRYIIPQGSMFFHRMGLSLCGAVQIDELKRLVDDTLVEAKTFDMWNAKRMKMTHEQYLKFLESKGGKREIIITAKEAIGLKAADRIVTVRCSKTLINKIDLLITPVRGMVVKRQFSGCPIITEPLSK